MLCGSDWGTAAPNRSRTPPRPRRARRSLHVGCVMVMLRGAKGWQRRTIANRRRTEYRLTRRCLGSSQASSARTAGRGTRRSPRAWRSRRSGTRCSCCTLYFDSAGRLGLRRCPPRMAARTLGSACRRWRCRRPSAFPLVSITVAQWNNVGATCANLKCACRALLCALLAPRVGVVRTHLRAYREALAPVGVGGRRGGAHVACGGAVAGSNGAGGAGQTDIRVDARVAAGGAGGADARHEHEASPITRTGVPAF